MLRKWEREKKNSIVTGNDAVKKAEKDKVISEDDSKKIQTEIQNITDKYTKEIDTVIAAKEKEVLAV